MLSPEDFPEHARWALRMWQDEAEFDDLNEDEALLLVRILERHRDVVAGYVRGIQVHSIYKNANGIRERDIEAERMAKTYINVCSALVAGAYGMVPKQKINGRDVDDLHLPEGISLDA